MHYLQMTTKEAFALFPHNVVSLTRFRCLQESHIKTEVPTIKHSLTKLTDETHQKLCRLMDWAYTVAYCEQPFTVFATLLNIEKKHGVNLGQTYANDKACQDIIGEIGGEMVDVKNRSLKQRSSV